MGRLGRKQFLGEFIRTLRQLTDVHGITSGFRLLAVLQKLNVACSVRNANFMRQPDIGTIHYSVFSNDNSPVEQLFY